MSIREITLPVTFRVGSLKELGLGGLKTDWVSAEQDGLKFSLTAGAGVGSRLLEASVTGDGKPSVYAQSDIGKLAEALWNEMRKDG